MKLAPHLFGAVYPGEEGLQQKDEAKATLIYNFVEHEFSVANSMGYWEDMYKWERIEKKKQLAKDSGFRRYRINPGRLGHLRSNYIRQCVYIMIEDSG